MTRLGDCAGGDGGKVLSTAAFLHFFQIFLSRASSDPDDSCASPNQRSFKTQKEKQNKEGDDAYGKTSHKLKGLNFNQWIERFLAVGVVRPRQVK